MIMEKTMTMTTMMTLTMIRMMLIDHLVTFPSGGDGLLMPSPRDWSLPTSNLFPSYPCEDDDDHGGDSNGLVDGDGDGDNVTDDDDGDYFLILAFAPIPLIRYHCEWDDNADYKDQAVT